MAEAFIKLYKKMLEWEWYDDPNTKILFLHCLLKANWKPCKWHGIDIEPGQFITSLQTLAVETQLSVKQVRVALDHLVKTGEVAHKGHAKYSVITVNNWIDYQGQGQTKGTQVANKGQAEGKQRATDKEYKEYKELKNINIKPKKFEPPSIEEVKAYAAERGNKVDAQFFYDYFTEGHWIDSSGKPVKNWKQKLVSWEKHQAPAAKSKIHDYKERKYDYEALQREAMGQK